MLKSVLRPHRWALVAELMEKWGSNATYLVELGHFAQHTWI